MKYLQSKEKGLTLIGVMVAVLMMTVGLVSLVGMANKNNQTGILIYRQIEANSLIYETFEALHGLRDRNVHLRNYAYKFEVTPITNMPIMSFCDFTALKVEDYPWAWDYDNSLDGKSNFYEDGYYALSCDEKECRLKMVEPWSSSTSPPNILEDERFRVCFEDSIGTFIQKNKAADNQIVDNCGDARTGSSPKKTRYYRRILIRNVEYFGTEEADAALKTVLYNCGSPAGEINNHLLKEIKVTIAWKTADGKERVLRDSTFLGNTENADQMFY